MGNITNMKNILSKCFELIFVQTYLHNDYSSLTLTEQYKDSSDHIFGKCQFYASFIDLPMTSYLKFTRIRKWIHVIEAVISQDFSVDCCSVTYFRGYVLIMEVCILTALNIRVSKYTYYLLNFTSFLSFESMPFSVLNVILLLLMLGSPLLTKIKGLVIQAFAVTWILPLTFIFDHSGLLGDIFGGIFGSRFLQWTEEFLVLCFEEKKM